MVKGTNKWKEDSCVLNKTIKGSDFDSIFPEVNHSETIGLINTEQLRLFYLYNYATKLLNIFDQTSRPVDKTDALRFADLLSKSTHSTNSDQHKMWVLAHAFSYMNLIEGWGTGIPRLLREMKEYGLPESEFVDMEIALRINLYRATSGSYRSHNGYHKV